MPTSTQEFRLDIKPGFEASTQPITGSRFVHLTFTLRRGMEAESAHERGYFSLLGTLLSRGCGGLNRAEFAADCDSRGANVNVYPGRDFLTIEVWALPDDLEWAVRTLGLMLWEPRLEEAEVEVASREALHQLQARADEKRSRLFDASRATLFDGDHHYSRPLLGGVSSLETCTRKKVLGFHSRLLKDCSAVICVTGDFQQTHLESLLERYLGDKAFTAEPARREQAEFVHGAERALVVPFPVEQAEILVALPGLCRWDKDYRLALFANEILGGAFLSRLTRAVRMRDGLAYSADSRFRAGLQAGVFWIGIQTDQQNVSQALNTVRTVVDTLREEGLDDEEFRHFKEFVGCSMPFDYDSLSSLTGRRLEHILFGEPWRLADRRSRFEEKMTQEATLGLFQRLLRPEEALVTVLGEDVSGEQAAVFHQATNGKAEVVPPLVLHPGPKVNKQARRASTLVESREEFELHRTSGGLHILVLPRTDVASVSLQFWSLTGSMDEKKGKTGLSHLLEHLMFRGTDRFPDGSFDAVLAQRGGLNNAFTSEDFTVYTDYVTGEGVEEAIGLEADRFHALALTEETFQTERSVVMEERSVRVTASPLGTAYEELQRLAFGEHPYAHPVIGWQEDLEALTLSDVHQHYKLATATERLLLVAAGGVKAEEVVTLAERLFHSPDSPVEKVWPVECAADDVQPLRAANLRLERRSGYSYLLLCYRFPREGHPDYEACELLARIVGEGESSRVYTKFVVQEQKFLEVWTSFESQTRDHPLFHLGLAATENFDHATQGDALADFLAGLHKQLNEQELEKARRSWLAEDAFLTDELEDWATEIAGRVMLMNWAKVWQDCARIEAVTLEQVKAAAKRYLSPGGAVYVSLQGLSE